MDTRREQDRALDTDEANGWMMPGNPPTVVEQIEMP